MSEVISASPSEAVEFMTLGDGRNGPTSDIAPEVKGVPPLRSCLFLPLRVDHSDAAAVIPYFDDGTTFGPFFGFFDRIGIVCTLDRLAETNNAPNHVELVEPIWWHGTLSRAATPFAVSDILPKGTAFEGLAPPVSEQIGTPNGFLLVTR